MITRRALLAGAALVPAAAFADSDALGYMATPGAPVMPTRRGIYNYPPGSGGGGSSSTWSTSDATTGSYVLSNGNLTATSGVSNWQTIRTTSSKTAGKAYVEFLVTTAEVGNEEWGFANATFPVANGNYLGGSAYSCGVNNNANYVSAGFTSNYAWPDTIANGDVIALAIDFSAQSIWMAHNNVWVNSSNPATGTAPMFSFVLATTGALFPAWCFFNPGGVVTLQPTAASQKYAPPAGFTAWG